MLLLVDVWAILGVVVVIVCAFLAGFIVGSSMDLT